MAKIPLEKRRAFGRRLRAARSAHKFTQSQLASKLGITSSTLSAWELGTASPASGELTSLRELLGPLPTLASIERAESANSTSSARRAAPSAAARRGAREQGHTGAIRQAGRAPAGPHAEFAQRLRAARYAAAVNQVAMAKRAGVAAGTYAQWEQGHHLPRPAALGRLREALSHHWGQPAQPLSLAAWSAAGEDLGVSSADNSAAFLALDRFVARKLPAAAYTTKRTGAPGAPRPVVVAAITVAAHLLRSARDGRISIGQIGILGALLREWLSSRPLVTAVPPKPTLAPKSGGVSKRKVSSGKPSRRQAAQAPFRRELVRAQTGS